MQSLRTIIQTPYLHVIGLYKQGHTKQILLLGGVGDIG